jgi:hypothetical protein
MELANLQPAYMRKGGLMRKIVVTLIVATFLSATVAAPVFADGWGRHSHVRGGGIDLFWPITAALVIPAAIIGTMAHLAIPEPAVYTYAPPPAAVETGVYAVPETYNESGVYAAQRGYYAPRGYYPARSYHRYGCGW